MRHCVARVSSLHRYIPPPNLASSTQPTANPPEMTVQKAKQLKVNELKTQLKRRSLPTNGLKKALQARLIDAITESKLATSDSNEGSNSESGAKGRAPAAKSKGKAIGRSSKTNVFDFDSDDGDDSDSDQVPPSCTSRKMQSNVQSL